jgi:hypothetical protein
MKDNSLTGEGGEGGGRGSESYDCKKAWSSVNHSILSGQLSLTGITDQRQSYSGEKKSPKFCVCLCLCISRRKLEGEGVRWGGRITVCVTIELAFLCEDDSSIRGQVNVTPATHECENSKASCSDFNCIAERIFYFILF